MRSSSRHPGSPYRQRFDDDGVGAVHQESQQVIPRRHGSAPPQYVPGNWSDSSVASPSKPSFRKVNPSIIPCSPDLATTGPFHGISGSHGLFSTKTKLPQGGGPESHQAAVARSLPEKIKRNFTRCWKNANKRSRFCSCLPAGNSRLPTGGNPGHALSATTDRSIAEP